MSNISIVTAFYDIGRGNWSPQHGHPQYLHRTVDTYIERFGYMTRLANDITVFTSEDLVEKIVAACDPKSNVNVVVFDALKHFNATREVIKNTQQSAIFKSKIHPSQIINPEYWNPDYVLVTNLKPYFVNKAIELKKVKNDLVSWVDFGYCRNIDKIPKSRMWEFNFDDKKIHLFSYKDYDNTPIEQIVCTNNVYILGAKAVAHKTLWPAMLNLMQSSFNSLLEKQLVDDDQGLWLYSYIKNPSLFMLHNIPDHQLGHDPFVLFNNFNTSCK